MKLMIIKLPAINAWTNCPYCAENADWAQPMMHMPNLIQGFEQYLRLPGLPLRWPHLAAVSDEELISVCDEHKRVLK